MKPLLVLILTLLLISQHVHATQMSGFAKQYYQDDISMPEAASSLPLFPTITIGNKKISLETSYLTDIANTFVQKDDYASWICLHSLEGITYWFISDNEMGRGLLTAIALAKDGNHKECMTSPEPIRVSIANIPLLDAPRQAIAQSFGNNEVIKKQAVLFYHETPVQDGFTQSNTVSYYFDGEKVRGVIVGQITSN